MSSKAGMSFMSYGAKVLLGKLHRMANQITQLLQSDKPVKWLFCGDSITHGAANTFGARDYPEHFSERVRYEMGRLRDIVINTAISGDTTQGLLNDFEWRVQQFAPHVTFIMMGMNDCSVSRQVKITPEEFRENLQKICDRLVAIDTVPVLQTTCPILPKSTPDREPYFANYMQIIRDVAQANDILLIDHHRHWLKNTGKLYYWMANAFHPNGHGHLAFAHFIFRELGIFDESSAVCRLFVP